MPHTSMQRDRVNDRAVPRLLAAVAAVVLAVPLIAPAGAGAVPREFFGVSAVEPSADDFAEMGAARVGTYRLLLHWPSVQPTQDAAYDWTTPDLEIASAARNGIRPLVFASGSPEFAGATPQSAPLGSGNAQSAWRRFLAAAVARYGPGGEFWVENPTLPRLPVREWQVWNEQNANAFFERPSPRRYAKLLKLSTKTIRHEDPTADVVLGGMFGYPNGNGSIYMKDYLKRFYRVRGIRSKFDGVALHPYAETPADLRYQVVRARRIMNRNRDRKTPIWITEVGWSTDGPSGWPLVTNKDGQAQRLRQTFKLLKRNRHKWGIRRVIWFAWRDFEQDVCRWCGGSGLVGLNGNPKPSLGAFKGFTKR
jgi:Glycosyl hydrolase catalytic core